MMHPTLTNPLPGTLTMMIEIALLPIKADETSAFEAGWKTVVHYLTRQPGYIAHSLGPQAEDPQIYVLQVQWQTLADHHAFTRHADFEPFAAGYRHLMASKATVYHYAPAAGL